MESKWKRSLAFNNVTLHEAQGDSNSELKIIIDTFCYLSVVNSVLVNEGSFMRKERRK